MFSNFTFNVLTPQTCFVLDFPNHHAAQAHLEQDSTDDERDTDPSESFKAQMDKMYSSLVWRSSTTTSSFQSTPTACACQTAAQPSCCHWYAPNIKSVFITESIVYHARLIIFSEQVYFSYGCVMLLIVAVLTLRLYHFVFRTARSI